MPQQAFSLELKQLTAEGVFEGLASVYNIEDEGGDLVEPGAFSKTLASSQQRPLLWQHRDPIGVVELSDTSSALIVKGKLSLGVQLAKDAYQLLKDGAVRGLSIGYTALQADYVGAVRHLKEIKLYEVSIVSFPMNEAATVTAIKSAQLPAIQTALSDLRQQVVAAMKR